MSNYSLFLLHILLYPVCVLRQPDHDPRLVDLTTPDAPGDDPSNVPPPVLQLHTQRTSGVSVTRVTSSLLVSSTDKDEGDVLGMSCSAVQSLTFSVAQNWNF